MAMDLFLLKKTLGYLLMPLPLVLIALVVAFITFKQKPKLARRLLLVATTVLLISTLPPTTKGLTSLLETSPPFKQQRRLDYIVTLGCYHINDQNWPATSRLFPCSLQRLVETLRIHQLHPEAQIIFSGGANKAQSNAVVMQEAAVSLGIEESKILIEPFPQDTAEEAMIIAPRVAGSQFALVTNASHMARAVNYFQRYGATAIPAPASPVVLHNNEPTTLSYFLPWPNKLKQFSDSWYELIGLLWQWLTGLFA
jgi:uncharacterized SAM-binding protein YcdF (DUF218 family)